MLSTTLIQLGHTAAMHEEGSSPSLTAFRVAYAINPESAEEVALQQLMDTLRSKDLSPQSINFLLATGVEYHKRIKILHPDLEGESSQPSVRECMAFLRIMGDIESVHKDRPPGEISRIIFVMLLTHFPVATLDHQKYYIQLFKDLLKQTHYDEFLANLTIRWALEFMRDDHSKIECTAIVNLVLQYILMNPQEDYSTSDLQTAFISAPNWPTSDVIHELRDTLGLGYEDADDEKDKAQ